MDPSYRAIVSAIVFVIYVVPGSNCYCQTSTLFEPYLNRLLTQGPIKLTAPPQPLPEARPRQQSDFDVTTRVELDYTGRRIDGRSWFAGYADYSSAVHKWTLEAGVKHEYEESRVIQTLLGSASYRIYKSEHGSMSLNEDYSVQQSKRGRADTYLGFELAPLPRQWPMMNVLTGLTSGQPDGIQRRRSDVMSGTIFSWQMPEIPIFGSAELAYKFQFRNNVTGPTQSEFTITRKSETLPIILVAGRKKTYSVRVQVSVLPLVGRQHPSDDD